MASFDPIFKPTLELEGYVLTNDPDDSGGETKFGITKQTARSYEYNGEMKDLTLELAKEIYKKKFWDSINLNFVKSQSVAHFLFDIGVNCGPWRAVKMVQRVLMLSFGKNLLQDGRLGQKTIDAINAVPASELHLHLKVIRHAYYRYISNQPTRDFTLDHYFETLNPKYPEKKLLPANKNKKYFNGWVNKRVHGFKFVA